MSDTETPKLDALLAEPTVFDTPPKRHRVRNAIIGGVLVLATTGAGVAVGLTVGGGAGTPSSCVAVVNAAKQEMGYFSRYSNAVGNFASDSGDALDSLDGDYSSEIDYLSQLSTAVTHLSRVVSTVTKGEKATSAEIVKQSKTCK